MAYNKRTWLGRQGTGLNKFSIGGASPVTIVNQPDSVTQVGDALSAGNLNDLEDRIEDAFDDVDTELDTKADEQDVTNLNNAINQLDHRLENIEQAKGDYIVSSYKDGSITPSGKGAWAIVEGLRGVSRVENNLNDDGDFYGVGYTTVTDTDYNHGCKATVASGRAYCQINKVFNLYAGRTYLLIFDIATNDSFGTGTQIAVNSSTIQRNYFTPVKGRNYVMWTQALDCSSWTQFQIYFADENGHDIEITNISLCDLNIYFGGTIPSDADTIAKIQQNYPHLLLPTEYGTRIVDSSYSGVRAEGVNIWDEEWETGYIDWTGNNAPQSNRIRSKNFIPVLPSTLYYYKAPKNLQIFYYDIDKNLISYESSSMSNVSRTTPSNCYYIRFYTYDTSYGGTYLHDIQICLDSLPDAIKTTYHPYMENTLSLPSTTLKSAGSVSEMYYPETGEQTKPLGSYTFDGTETWTKRDTNVSGKSFYTTTLPIKNYGVSVVPNLLCLGFVAVTYLQTFQCVNGCGSTEGLVSIYDSAHDNITGSAFSAFMAGKTIYFELATPDPSTFVTPIIDNTLLTESGGRMSTVQTGTVVDGIADLGFITL